MATDWDLVARTNALEKRVANVRREITGEDAAALSAAQVRADAMMAQLGRRASPPIAGETPLDYRRRMLKDIAPYAPQFKDAGSAASMRA